MVMSASVRLHAETHALMHSISPRLPSPRLRSPLLDSSFHPVTPVRAPAFTFFFLHFLAAASTINPTPCEEAGLHTLSHMLYARPACSLLEGQPDTLG